MKMQRVYHQRVSTGKLGVMKNNRKDVNYVRKKF